MWKILKNPKPPVSIKIWKRSSLVAQMVKNPPAMQKTWLQSMGWDDPLGKEMATHSSILAWRIPWTEEPGGWGGGNSPWGHKVSDMTEQLTTHTWKSQP